MPEIFEAGHFFPTYIWFFIVLVTIVHGPNGLNVIGLWCDLSARESRAAATREATLLAYAKTFDKHALARGHLAHWAKDLQDLADTIPDTSTRWVWSGLHAPIRRQISPNHASWDTFSSALRDLKHGIETTPTSLPVPWHRCYLPIHIPYQIGNTPSHSGLVVKITRHMPELFRGRDPDPSRQKKRSKARSISPAHSHVSDSDDEDIDTTIVLETEILTLDPRVARSTNRFFTEQSLLNHLYLYQFEPLLHTSPQIYTRKQWNGVIQVPNGPSKHRGFKIGYAIEFLSHVLCIGELLKRKRKVMKLLMSLDRIYNYSAWCLYTVEWLRQIFREGPEQLTLLEALSAPGRQPFRGLGRYGANEVLSIAGIPGWTLLSVIVADKGYYCMSRATSTEDMLDDQDVDHSINATLNQQLQYIETLRTHGWNHTYVSEIEADLIDKYNEASLNTWDENEKAKDSSARQNVFSNARKTDMSKVFFPLDMANIRTSVTKFGHLGALIAGEYWDTVMSELLQSQRTLTQLEAEYLGLPAMLLSPSELLPLKPQHLLNSKEHSALVALYGWSENPIAKYFSQFPNRSEQTIFDLHNAQKRKDTMFNPLYLLERETVKREYTIKFIKEKTKGWTVGPCDFVGHGRSVHHGSSTFIGLCFWHPDLSASQMVAMQASWDARSRYASGMRKMTADQIKAEKTWRSKAKSSIVKDLGEAATSASSAGFFFREINIRRKRERDELKQKIRYLMSDDGKARLSGPKDSRRVKHRSQISSLARKWRELALNTIERPPAMVSKRVSIMSRATLQPTGKVEPCKTLDLIEIWRHNLEARSSDIRMVSADSLAYYCFNIVHLLDGAYK
ncbi:hypothetical protein B0H10DRAFT_1946064 [Mycena sp. CBHHK59/15]|nr:hypothetical protein B0H10DRAFT_1946064 [Mycena sp. CBHHK59/15]